MQGKIEAYNKIVKSEFLALEDPSEMFLQRLITSTIHTKDKQQSVTHVGN
jgi:hypothetical protein